VAPTRRAVAMHCLLSPVRGDWRHCWSSFQAPARFQKGFVGPSDKSPKHHFLLSPFRTVRPMGIVSVRMSSLGRYVGSIRRSKDAHACTCPCHERMELAGDSRRTDLIRSEIERIAPDLIAFEEVIKTPERDQLEELLHGRVYTAPTNSTSWHPHPLGRPLWRERNCDSLATPRRRSDRSRMSDAMDVPWATMAVTVPIPKWATFSSFPHRHHGVSNPSLLESDKQLRWQILMPVIEVPSRQSSLATSTQLQIRRASDISLDFSPLTEEASITTMPGKSREKGPATPGTLTIQTVSPK